MWARFVVMLALVAASGFAHPYSLTQGMPALFLDDFLIETGENIARTLHSPIKERGGAEPVVTLGNAFDGQPHTLEANGTIVYDTRSDRYVMFCIGYASSRRMTSPWDCVRLYRFESTDALTWTGDSQGQWVFPRSEADLRDDASGANASYVDMFSCYYDVQDEAWPYKGWLHFANWGDEREGVYYMRSHDGVIWERGPMVINACAGKNDPSARRLEVSGHRMQGPGDVTLFSHDPETGTFLGLFKFYSPDPLPNNNLLRSRAYHFVQGLDRPFNTAQLDRIDLMPPGDDREGNLPADEYYASTAWRYGSMWLGTLKIYHDQDDYPWSRKGCAFLKFIWSRDGLHWSKVHAANQSGIPEVWLPNGEEGGNNGRNDGGYITDFSQGPIRLGDDLMYYYGASSYGKHAGPERRISGGGIFRARLRRDGFVSISGGEFTTIALTSPVPALHVNAIGPLTIDVLASDGTVRHHAKIQSDSLRHLVPCGGGAFRLRIVIETGGHLFSITPAP